MKRKIAIILSLVMLTALTACSSETASTANGNAETKAEENVKIDDAAKEESKEETKEEVKEETKKEEVEQDDDENYDTGDASLDNVRNQDEIGENEMLVLSFGTSFNDSRRLTIGAIEMHLKRLFLIIR